MRFFAFIIGFSLAASAAIIPANRTTIWNPGLNAAGGIPHRTTIYRTIQASSFGNGSQDATAGIQAALDSCPPDQVVLLGAGNFRINQDGLIMDRNRITLRGAGPSATRLLKDTTVNWLPVVGIGRRWSGDKFLSAVVNLAADGVKGSRTITLAAAPSPAITAGEVVLIDQLTDTNLTKWSPNSPPGDDSRGWFCRANRPLSQVLEVESASGTTVTFTTPLHIGFQKAFTAQFARYGEDWLGLAPQPFTQYSGVEDLYLQKGSSGNITLSCCAHCWVRNVESAHTVGPSVDLVSCFRCEIRDSYLHTSDDPNPGGGGYLLSLARGSADNLIENNAIWFGNKVMVMRATGGGNVIAYNYMEDALIGYQYNWVESGLNASHMTTPHFELFEGNQCFNFDGESTWGNSIYNTVLRNNLTGKRRDAGNVGLTDEGYRRAASLSWGHYWYSFVGNVLGYQGMSPAPFAKAFTYETFYPWNGDPIGLWKVGVGENWSPADPRVAATLIRHGNFDYATNSVKWDSTISDLAIPNSLYLTKKPAFFGSCAWPWVSPDAAVKTAILPALARFNTIMFDSICPPCLASSRIIGDNSRSKALGHRPFEILYRPNDHSVRLDYVVLRSGRVRIEILDLRGRKCGMPLDAYLSSGDHCVVWSAGKAAPGIYLCRLTAEGKSQTARLLMR